MPATTNTIEKFPADTPPKSQVEQEQKLKIQAGAVKSVISGGDTKEWVLTTTWNVLGSNDD